MQVFLNVLMFVGTIIGFVTLVVSFFSVCGAAVFFAARALGKLIMLASRADTADTHAVPEPSQWKTASFS